MKKAVVKAEILISTPNERAEHIVRLKVHDRWYETLRAFYRENAAEARSWRVEMEPWGKSASDGAIRLFHELRDRICEQSGDMSQEYLSHIKRTLKDTYGVKLPNGKLKSVASYTVSELGRLIDGAFLMAYEAGADVRDLEAEKGEIR